MSPKHQNEIKLPENQENESISRGRNRPCGPKSAPPCYFKQGESYYTPIKILTDADGTIYSLADVIKTQKPDGTIIYSLKDGGKVLDGATVQTVYTDLKGDYLETSDGSVVVSGGSSGLDKKLVSVPSNDEGLKFEQLKILVESVPGVVQPLPLPKIEIITADGRKVTVQLSPETMELLNKDGNAEFKKILLDPATTPQDRTLIINAQKKDGTLLTASTLTEYKKLLDAMAGLSTPAGMSPAAWDKLTKEASVADVIAGCQQDLSKCQPKIIGNYEVKVVDGKLVVQSGANSETTLTQDQIYELQRQRDRRNEVFLQSFNPATASLISNYETLKSECNKPNAASDCKGQLDALNKQLTASGTGVIQGSSLTGIQGAKDYYLFDKDVSKLPDGCTGGDSVICGGILYQRFGSGYKAYIGASKEDATSATKLAAGKAYTEQLEFYSGIAVAYAQDKGYLDWLSMSGWGEWGRDYSKTVSRILSPEQWKQNFCNDQVVDIEDNDQGAIFDPSTPGASLRVAGTFAAEVTQLEIDGKPQYMYVITSYITNPQRPIGPGHREGDGQYDFRLDASLREQEMGSCKENCITGDYDMINGTFDMKEGINFASGTGPKKSLLYLPVKYQKICFHFDKSFPSSTNGKMQYCRDIKEKVYDVGSPFIESPATPGSPGSPMPLGTAGTGSDNNGGNGAFAGELS